MKNSKKFTLVALLGLMIGSVSACGATPSSPTTSGPTSSSDPTSVVPDKTLEISFWTTFNKDWHDQIYRKVEKFEEIILENEGVNIEFDFVQQGGYEDVEEKITKGLTSGIYPTIAVAYPDTVANLISLVPERVVNLDPYINDPEIGFGNDKIAALEDNYTLEEAYYSSYIEEGTKYPIEGTYSFPFVKSTEVMVYNKNVVESITIPEINGGRQLTKRFLENCTWDEFVTILEYIKSENEGPNGFDVTWPAYYDSDSNYFITKMMQNDIPFIQNADTAEDRVLFNNDLAKQEIKELKTMYDNELITTKGVEGVYGNTYFERGEVLFNICSSGGVGYNDLGSSVPVEVVKAPFDNNNPSYVSQGPTVTFLRHNNDPDNELKIEYAFRLIKYLTNAKNNADIAIVSGGYVPVNVKSYETEAYDYFLNDDTQSNNLLSRNANCVYNTIAGNYYNLPTFKGSATIRDDVGKIVTSVLASTETDIDKVIDEQFAAAENNSILACK